MNVLILTPDAVGSTLLQRLLTIYMQFHDFDRPVINMHELTNGLSRYYCPEFNREIVGKRDLKTWGYFQSLQEVIEILDSVDHYKTSRLAHYHIIRRGDSIQQQIPFYNYLNENFYIIACQRTNVFEHALSMALSRITKKLNVYSPFEKASTFLNMYQNGIELDLTSFASSLDSYRDYLTWSKQYFNIGSYFNYEKDLPEIEKFILNLPAFSQFHKKITWAENFNIDFNDWNRYTYLSSDIGSLISQKNNQQLVSSLKQKMLPIADAQLAIEDYQKTADPSWPAIHTANDFESLSDDIKTQFEQRRIRDLDFCQFQDAPKQRFLSKHKYAYEQARQAIDRMMELGIIISGPPIKKQTLDEKKKIIKNFDQCVDFYNNQWCVENPGISQPIDAEGLVEHSQKEQKFWFTPEMQDDLLSYQPPTD